MEYFLLEESCQGRDSSIDLNHDLRGEAYSGGA